MRLHLLQYGNQSRKGKEEEACLHERAHLLQHLTADRLGAVLVVPVHRADAVQLLHAQLGAQLRLDLLQRFLLLGVQHQVGDGLPDVPQLVPARTDELVASGADPLLHLHVPLAVTTGKRMNVSGMR